MNQPSIKLSLIPALLFATNLLAEETLEPITVVSSNKTEQSIQNTTSNVEVITAEEIEERGYQSVAEAIEHIAGISVTHAGGLGQQTTFFVRGADAGKVLVLLDGMRLNDPSTTDGRTLLDSFTTNAIQQIEIIKGGSSSIWGSNASAGVINIITKTPKEGIHGSLAATYGSYNTRGLDADIAYKDEKFTAQFLGALLKTDGFSALAPRNAEDDGYTNKNANLKLGYAFDANNKLMINYNHIKTKTKYDDQYSANGANDDYSHADSDQQNLAADYRYSQGNYEATLHASKGTYDRNYYTTSDYWGDGVNHYHALIKEYSFINAYTYNANGKAVLGFEYKDIDGFNQYNDYPASQSDYRNKAIFLSNTYLLGGTTLLETNLRHDHYDAFESKTTYKIGIKHDHPSLPGFATGANYYTSYDTPSSYQLANPVFGTLLKPSYTNGYELYARYKEWFSVTYFDNKIEDNIDYDMANWGYYNVDGTSKFKGLELASTYTMPDIGLVFSGNYTHLFKYEKEDGTPLIRRPKDTLNASVDYYTDSQIHYGIDAQYIGNREEFGHDTGNYTLWNLNFGTPIMKDTDLSIHAKNIFDKEYQSVYGYATEGRSVYARIKYSF
ncbi:MAG: TonB-dependent receptor [Campylobacterales bacterium]|nr:TonB-dependent receptor [Campylobacterales bacterium]